MPVVLFSKGAQLCVDLRSYRRTPPDVLSAWRADYVKGLGADPLLFATPTGMVSRAKSSAPDAPSAVRIDRSWKREAELYTPAQLRTLIERENRNALDILVAQLRSQVGVVPFVGAGLSIPFGFPGWPDFLREAATLHPTPGEVLRLVTRNRLIEAASELADSSADRFQRLVEKWFGTPVSEDRVRTGAVSLLPLIAKGGPTITTNFDRVLETAFRAGQAPFENSITGDEPDNVIRAMHRNEHVLIKIHGDALDRNARVFTGLEYERKYGRNRGKTRRGRETGIPMLARVMFTNRPLLFLGCSLERDRTLDVLAELHRQISGLTHYAVIAADYSIEKLSERRRALDAYGISPLWFLPGYYDGIERLLMDLVHESSTQLIWRSDPTAVAAPRTEKARHVPATQGTRAPSVSQQATRLINRMAPQIVNGEVVLFLGAGIHLGKLPNAYRLYSELGRNYGIPKKDTRRAEVAQYVIDRSGRARAWAAMKRLLSTSPKPSLACEFIADLPSILRRHTRNDELYQWVLTTNYDTVLEKAFATRNEPFHLLSYQAEGRHTGRFAHRDLTGSVRIVERPDNVLGFGDPAHVIVKVNGGISWDPNVPETVAIAPLDFSVSSGRLPGAFPHFIRQALRTRTLLILGSSLYDPHIQRIVRWSAGSSREIKTFAVLTPISESAAKYWPAAGVELLDCDLKAFIPALRRKLESL
jgi:hypothetical protein